MKKNQNSQHEHWKIKDFSVMPSKENLEEKSFPTKISIPKGSIHVKVE